MVTLHSYVDLFPEDRERLFSGTCFYEIQACTQDLERGGGGGGGGGSNVWASGASLKFLALITPILAYFFGCSPLGSPLGSPQV